MTSPDHENAASFSTVTWSRIVGIASKAKKLGEDDPRRVVHSFKVGLAVTLVSMLYYFEPLYDGFGSAAIWAVLTVVVVMEFSVGATLGRGFNRMCATMIAGALAVGAHRVATHTGEKGEPILISVFVFIVAATVSFARFFPKMKARYDYGLMMFILTFCLITVSGYRDDELWHLAHRRLTTIIIGSIASLIICVFICPVWIGEELHNSVAANIEKLGNFLEGFGDEYFRRSLDEQADDTDKSYLQAYKSILASKSNEDTMANLARWEPFHGKFKFRHPWKQYLKVGTETRKCAFKIEALSCYLNSDIQISVQMRSKLEEICTKISSETGKALKELASSVKEMAKSSSAEAHIANSREAAETLKTLSNSFHCEGAPLLEIVPTLTVASLLVDVVACAEDIAKSVETLARMAHFKDGTTAVSPPEQPRVLLHRGAVTPVSDGSNHHVIITINERSPDEPNTENNSSAPVVG